jgi:NhaA family Na+:H+ antiporter
MWLGCYRAGLHPALALLPIVPFLRRSARDLSAIGRPDRGVHQTASHFESVFEYPMQGLAFFFGLVNAGVVLRGFGTGTWAVLTASLVGRPLGILIATGIAVAAGLRLPRHIGWKALVVMALAASVSLGFGLFFAAAVFPDGPLLSETKFGAALTSLGLILALGAARLLRVGRFVDLAAPRQTVDPRLSRGRV